MLCRALACPPCCLASAEAFADVAERGDRDDDCESREYALLPEALLERSLAVGDHEAPVGVWRLDGEAEERERGDVDHGVTEVDRHAGEDLVPHVWQDVSNRDDRPIYALQFGAF